MPAETQQQKVDIRVYLAIILFRWKVITLCLLYSLLGGVLYINFAPKQYQTKCKMMIFRDPNLELNQAQVSPIRSFAMHAYLLKSEKLRRQVVKKLQPEWGEKMGNQEKMMLEVRATPDRAVGSTLDVGVSCSNQGYAESFLNALLEEHRQEAADIQRTTSDSASKMLEKELASLQEEIRGAEDRRIEYLRLWDIPRGEAKASMESRYLEMLMGRQSQLITEIMLMEAAYPTLKGASAAVISDVHRLTRETGLLEVSPEEEPAPGKDGKDESRIKKDETGDDKGAPPPDLKLPDSLSADREIDTKKEKEKMAGWANLRAKLKKLQDREKEMSANLKAEHPQLKEIRKEIQDVQAQLDVAAETELGNMKERHQAMIIQLNAVESAIYKWQAKNLLQNTRRAELNRISAVVQRYEESYKQLYQKLQDMKVSEELKSEHIRTVEPVGTDPRTVWPDPLKALLVALVIGLGSGFGLAMAAQLLDNKVQTIADVEQVLGVPFIGGIPYWVHSGLERTVRPIVTEEHSTGAIEAYRVIRTSILSSLKKMNEKILFVTSADSREGKTLTTLNLSIMISQMGKKVLLVDMDLRRGRLHRSLGMEKDPGVLDALKDGRPLKAMAQETRFSNLYFIPSGTSVDDAAELLQSANLEGLFEDVVGEYDYIIVDTSPVLRVTDMAVISAHAIGAVLYIARVNHTAKQLVKYSIDLLKDAKIIGLVLNSIELHKISGLYYAYQYPNYAYYSNAYAYGHDYYYYSEGGDKRLRGRRKEAVGRFKRDVSRWFRDTFFPIE